MRSTAELQTLLESTLDPRVSVYFQPPINITIRYPALVYERNTPRTVYADDIRYKWHWQYTMTYITKDPYDSNVDKLLGLPYVSHSKHFVSDSLHHDTFTIHW